MTIHPTVTFERFCVRTVVFSRRTPFCASLTRVPGGWGDWRPVLKPTFYLSIAWKRKPTAIAASHVGGRADGVKDSDYRTPHTAGVVERRRGGIVGNVMYVGDERNAAMTNAHRVKVVVIIGHCICDVPGGYLHALRSVAVYSPDCEEMTGVFCLPVRWRRL